ncbi:MAG: hypothetical protein KJ914_09155 [Gammaproteobacteria bacterium]|nr:hypothetical protein [Gammaproteobacteria bacterium]MBU1723647.1 hypothetical protein [Gammaproteobacteria bacterium]MBU2005643.1 hypothetical protein [Gammaproteobacteria bacterium]
MDKGLQNLSFYFEDGAAPALFQAHSVDVVGDIAEQSALHKDILLSFKRTPLAELVERFTEHVKSKYDSRVVGVLSEFVSYVLLVFADPSFIKSAKRLRVIDSNAFSGIEPLFKRNAVGSRCMPAALVEALELDTGTQADVELMLAALVRDEVLKLEDGVYCIEGVVIKNLKIK